MPNKLVRTTWERSFGGRKAQKFGYRNKELISPEKGLRSSDSFSCLFIDDNAPGVSTYLELAKGKE